MSFANLHSFIELFMFVIVVILFSSNNVKKSSLFKNVFLSAVLLFLHSGNDYLELEGLKNIIDRLISLCLLILCNSTNICLDACC